MWILKLAWKNIWRNKQRTAITMASIFFAVVLSVLTSSLKTGIFENLIRNMVGFYSGYIQVHKKGYWEEKNLDNSFQRDSILEFSISNTENIKSISARLESFILISTGTNTKGCIVLGLEPENENKVTNFQKMLTKGEYIKKGNNGIVISEGLLKKLKVNIADTIVLIGQGYHGETAAGKYKINGIIKLGSPSLNDQLLIMPFDRAQELFSAYNMTSTYAIGINNQNKLNKTTHSIRQKAGKYYEVMTWEEMMPDIKQHISTDSRNMQIIQGILYLLICFGIFSTLVMMIAERSFEMGMLISIGMQKRILALTLMLESLLTVLIGCIVGIICSIPLIMYFKIHPIRLTGNAAVAFEKFGFEPIFPTSTNPEIFLTQGLIVFLLGLALSSYVLIKTLSLNPVEAIRK